MTVGFIDSAEGTHNIPKSVHALSSLPDIDYADQFTLSTDADATPEQWARAMYGDIPSVAELLIWRPPPVGRTQGGRAADRGTPDDLARFLANGAPVIILPALGVDATADSRAAIDSLRAERTIP